MTPWKDAIFGRPIGIGTPVRAPSIAELEKMQREFIRYGANTTLRKAFPPMWIETDGSVTLMGQLMIRLHKGNVGIEAGTVYQSVYKNIEIIDVRQHRDEVHVYVSIKDKAPFTLKDNADLFPSDALLTQFRTLAGG